MRTIKLIYDGKSISVMVICQQDQLMLALSPETGNLILIQLIEDGECRMGSVEIARNIEPKGATEVMKFLQGQIAKEADARVKAMLSFMKVAFLGRILCRVGEGDEKMKRWVLRHQELYPEVQEAWKELSDNYGIRVVDKGFSIKRVKKTIDKMMTEN